MSVTIEFEIEGEKQLSRRLHGAVEDLEDWSEALDASGDLLLKSFELNFEQRGTLFQSGGWKPRTKNYPWPLLEKSGNMRGGFVKGVTSTQLVIGNSMDYFKYHQSNKPRKRLPRRVMMMIDRKRRADIVREFQKLMNKAIAVRGPRR